MANPRRVDKSLLSDELREELDSKLSGAHVHNESDIVDLDKYSKSETDAKLNLKLDVTSGLDWSQITGKPQLADGSWKTPVNSSADLPLEGNEDGDIRLTLGEEKYVFTWDASLSQWILIGANDTNMDWETIQHKPATFPPSEHAHPYSSLTGTPTSFPPSTHNHDAAYYKKSEVDTALLSKSNTNHAHDWLSITNKPSTFVPSAHDHDTLYYTKQAADSKYAEKANIVHTHTWVDVTNKPLLFPPIVHNHDDIYYTETEVDAKLLGKASTIHVHPVSAITGLQAELDSKSLSTHDHDGRYNTKSEVTSLLSNKSNITHTHAELHTHPNKAVVDKLSQSDLDLIIAHEGRLSDIENGYTEGHTHSNLSTLNKVTYSGASATIDLKVIEDTVVALDKKFDKTGGLITGVLQIQDTTLSLDTITFTGTTASGMRVTNSHGYVSIAPLNTSGAHIYTDRALFFFNKTLVAILGAFSSYNTDMLLQRVYVTKLKLGATEATFTDVVKAPGYFKTNGEEVETTVGSQAKVNTHANNSAVHITSAERTIIGTVSGKSDKSYVDTELAKKSDSTTLSGHTGNSSIHVTSTQVNAWNNKAEIANIPTLVSALSNDAGYITASEVPTSGTLFTVGAEPAIPVVGQMWGKVL